MLGTNDLQPGWRYANGFEGIIAIGPNLQIKLLEPPRNELPLRERLKENWLPVPEYECLYEVSDMGRVRRITPFRRGIKPWTGRKKRPRVDLYKNNVKKHKYVYDLVLMAFVGPKPESPKHFACHLNDDPWDNRLVNLIWGTQSTNERHKHANKRIMSVEAMYRWDRSYQLTDEQIYKIWSCPYEDDLLQSWEFNVPRETIQLIKWNMAMIPIPTDQPEVLRKEEEKAMAELPF